MLAVWSAVGAVAARHEPLEVWREWADDVRGGPMSAGHFLPEEAPAEIVRQLKEFFG